MNEMMEKNGKMDRWIHKWEDARMGKRRDGDVTEKRGGEWPSSLVQLWVHDPS